MISLRGKPRPFRAATLALVLAGCGTAKPVDLPDPLLPSPAEDPLGDVLSAAAGRLEQRIVRAVGEGRAKPVVRRYLVDDVRTMSSVRHWYDRKAAQLRWAPIPELQQRLGPGDRAFGYEAPGKVFIVAWIDRGRGQVALLTMRFD